MNAVFCNGRPATAEDLQAPALRNYGHFTTLQVRGRAAQGLGLHLQRLQSATLELFGTTLGEERVRQDLCAALDHLGTDDASVRITVFSKAFSIDQEGDEVPVDLLVSLSPPSTAEGKPLRVCSHRLERVLPHLKHVATFPLLHARRRAKACGFDDVLLVDAAGRVCEGSIWNVGLWDGQGVVWPEAPMLRGVTQQLLEAGLREAGVVQRRAQVALSDLGDFAGAFATYSRGLHMLASVDRTEFERSPRMQAALQQALATRPWERI